MLALSVCEQRMKYGIDYSAATRRARDLAALPSGGWGRTEQARRALEDALLVWAIVVGPDGVPRRKARWVTPGGGRSADCDAAVDAWLKAVA